jgi:2-methylcitrate dehydratase PrpD
VSTTVRAPAAAQLGQLAATVRLESLPAEVVEKVRCNLLHDLACALAAYPLGEEVWPLVRGLRPAESTLICSEERVPAEHAAFANAVMVHGRAQDDTHFPARCHAGACVIPVALALAEAEGLGGDRAVPAIVAGYEVATALGELLALTVTGRGLRSSMLFGTLGAAACGASMLGLDAERSAHAIAIATSFAGGLNQAWVEGSSEWRWELGMAARNGIVAARLAAGGARGARQAFEGEAGFAKAFAGDESWEAPADWQLGERWRILDVIYKPYPVCNITQSPVALAVALASELDLQATEVRTVRCYLNPADRNYPGTVNLGPYEDVGATLMSAHFCLAMALADRTATMAGLRRFDDPGLLELITRIDVLEDDAIPVLASRLELETVDGRRFERQLVPDDSTYGWDWDGVLLNAQTLSAEMRAGDAAVGRLADEVQRFHHQPSIAPLMDALRP